MTNLPLILAEINQTLIVLAGVGAITFVVFTFVTIWANRYVKVGPNQALVISGMKRRVIAPDGKVRDVGYRIVTGGGTFIWPVFEKVDLLSLEVLKVPFELADVRTQDGGSLRVSGLLQVKISSDAPSLSAAAERFLSMTTEQIQSTAAEVLEGAVRKVLGEKSTESLLLSRTQSVSAVEKSFAAALAPMGMALVGLNIREFSENLTTQPL